MNAILSLGLGYLLGCFNPAAWVGRKKNVDLKKTGTKNLGATNTALVLGKKAGYFVLIFDIFKSFFSYRLAKYLFPQLRLAGLIAGFGTLLGHCFPVTMGFSGGLVLALDPLVFCVLLSLGIFVALKMNYGVYLAVTTTVLFPLAAYCRTGDVGVLLATAASSALIFGMHLHNLKRAVTHEDPIEISVGLKQIFKSDE